MQCRHASAPADATVSAHRLLRAAAATACIRPPHLPWPWQPEGLHQLSLRRRRRRRRLWRRRRRRECQLLQQKGIRPGRRGGRGNGCSEGSGDGDGSGPAAAAASAEAGVPARLHDCRFCCGRARCVAPAASCQHRQSQSHPRPLPAAEWQDGRQSRPVCHCRSDLEKNRKNPRASGARRSGLLEEVSVPFVGGVALAAPSFNGNPFYAANN